MDKHSNFISYEEKKEFLKNWISKLLNYLPENEDFVLGDIIKSSNIDEPDKQKLLELDNEHFVGNYGDTPTYLLVSELRKAGYIKYVGGFKIRTTETASKAKSSNINDDKITKSKAQFTWRDIWKDPVWSKVIAQTIIAISTIILTGFGLNFINSKPYNNLNANPKQKINIPEKKTTIPSKKIESKITVFIKNGLYGFLKDSTEYIKAEYDYANEFYENKAVVKKNGKIFVIDSDGKKLFDVPYKEAYGFRENRLGFRDFNDKKGYLNEKGEVVIPAKFRGGWDFYQGLAKVEFNNKRGYIDLNGKVIIPIRYEDGTNFQQGRAILFNKKKCAIIDLNGKFIKPFIFDFAWDYVAGYAVVSSEKKFYYVDLNGEEAFYWKYEDRFDEASSFNENGIASVKIKNEEFCINTNFQKLSNCDQRFFIRVNLESVENIWKK